MYGTEQGLEISRASMWYTRYAEDTFLYFASGSKWWVGTEERMRDCSAFGWIHSEGDCACPSSSGCQGKWMQNTGQDNSQ